MELFSENNDNIIFLKIMIKIISKGMIFKIILFKNDNSIIL